MTEPLHTIPETASILRCSDDAVRSMVKSGALRASLVAGRYLVAESAIQAHLDAHSTHAAVQEQPRRRRRRVA